MVDLAFVSWPGLIGGKWGESILYWPTIYASSCNGGSSRKSAGRKEPPPFLRLSLRDDRPDNGGAEVAPSLLPPRERSSCLHVCFKRGLEGGGILNSEGNTEEFAGVGRVGRILSPEVEEGVCEVKTLGTFPGLWVELAAGEGEPAW